MQTENGEMEGIIHTWWKGRRSSTKSDVCLFHPLSLSHFGEMTNSCSILCSLSSGSCL